MYQLLKIVTFTLLTLVVLTACKPKVGAMTKVPNPADIDLNPIGQPGPIGDPGKFSVHTPNRGCVRGSVNGNGCVRFKANENGTIIFALNGQAHAKTCADSAVRVISEIKLTTTDATPGPQPSDKGDFTSPTSYPLAAKYQTYGFPNLKIATGEVFPGISAETAKNRVVITNLNTTNLPGPPPGRNIWYQVTVKRCSDNLYWVTDPRFENDGMN
jgi:hypothetical protein